MVVWLGQHLLQMIEHISEICRFQTFLKITGLDNFHNTFATTTFKNESLAASCRPGQGLMICRSSANGERSVTLGVAAFVGSVRYLVRGLRF